MNHWYVIRKQCFKLSTCKHSQLANVTELVWTSLDFVLIQFHRLCAQSVNIGHYRNIQDVTDYVGSFTSNVVMMTNTNGKKSTFFGKHSTFCDLPYLFNFRSLHTSTNKFYEVKQTSTKLTVPFVIRQFRILFSKVPT